MAERRTGNFIQTFVDTYKDGYVPTKFYLWGAISTVAAALERKVWIPFGKNNIYPHLFITLVSAPGIGKSSAMRPGRKLLQQLETHYGKKIRFLPNKLTEPKMLDIMNAHEFFTYNNTHYQHTSLYFVASEGATATKDLYGGFVDTMTALYDGDDLTKATVSRSREIKIVNPCLNFIGGYTFSSLNDLLTTEGIMGGFASRVIYIVHKDKIKRVSKWQGDTRGQLDEQINGDLLYDLNAINDMVGPFTADTEYAEAYDKWFTEHDLKTQEIENEKLRALMVRKPDLVKKLSMILSASRTSDRLLEINDWNHALGLIEANEKELPGMIRKGQAMQTGTQSGINAAILDHMDKNTTGVVLKRDIVSTLSAKGFKGDDVHRTLHNLLSGESFLAEINGSLVLTDTPDFYL
jgi:hypothetical protein